MLGMGASESRFEEFVERLGGAVGHADRDEPLRAYCMGLMLPGDRKSVEPMAARIDPQHVGALHQAMHHFIANAPWSEDAVMAAVRAWALPLIETRGPIRVWIVDDTGFPKKGQHSVGVARQYCGQLGKQDNCQVAVSLSVANDAASLPIAFRLYLPEEWASDKARRRKAGVPEKVVFRTKPAIALEQIDAALRAGVTRGVVLADAAYGNDTDFRDQLTALGLPYVVGLQSSSTVWRPGTVPLPPKPYGGMGRPPKLVRRDARHQPVAVKALAMSLPSSRYRTVAWREGTAGMLRSRFAAVRVRPAHRDMWRATPRMEEWLLIEWPPGESEPTKYFLSTLPAATPLKALVDLAKLRWRIERDYQDLKQELGLGHYEGRGWRGFHHHAVLSIAAYGFLVSELSPIPPSGARWHKKLPRRPKTFRPRGSPHEARTPRATLDRHPTMADRRVSHRDLAALPLLPPINAGASRFECASIYGTVSLRRAHGPAQADLRGHSATTVRRSRTSGLCLHACAN
jgi:SRSO17 transposase